MSGQDGRPITGEAAITGKQPWPSAFDTESLAKMMNCHALPYLPIHSSVQP